MMAVMPPLDGATELGSYRLGSYAATLYGDIASSAYITSAWAMEFTLQGALVLLVTAEIAPATNAVIEQLRKQELELFDENELEQESGEPHCMLCAFAPGSEGEAQHINYGPLQDPEDPALFAHEALQIGASELAVDGAPARLSGIEPNSPGPSS